jgi:hypothetical protein
VVIVFQSLVELFMVAYLWIVLWIVPKTSGIASENVGSQFLSLRQSS